MTPLPRWIMEASTVLPGLFLIGSQESNRAADAWLDRLTREAGLHHSRWQIQRMNDREGR